MNPFIGFFVGFIQAVGVMLGFSHTSVVPIDQTPTPQQVVDQYGTLPHGLPTTQQPQVQQAAQQAIVNSNQVLSSFQETVGSGESKKIYTIPAIQYGPHRGGLIAIQASKEDPFTMVFTSSSTANFINFGDNSESVPVNNYPLDCSEGACTGSLKHTYASPGTYIVRTFTEQATSQSGPGGGITSEIATVYDTIRVKISEDQQNLVSGMEKYTDNDFGFSFWYPSAFIMQPDKDQSYLDYLDGFVKSVTLYDKSKPVETIVLHKAHADPRGSVFSYRIWGTENTITGDVWFSTSTKKWIENGQPLKSWDRDLGQQTSVIPKTMGGLQIFNDYGGAGDFLMVPISPNYVLNFINRDNGYDFEAEQALIKTVVAVDPSVATPVSTSEQMKAIQAEKDAYMPSSSSVSTIGQDLHPKYIDEYFFTQNGNVYYISQYAQEYGLPVSTSTIELVGADAASFKKISDFVAKPTPEGGNMQAQYKDKNSIYTFIIYNGLAGVYTHVSSTSASQ